jgi:HEAT repeat protein
MQRERSTNAPRPGIRPWVAPAAVLLGLAVGPAAPAQPGVPKAGPPVTKKQLLALIEALDTTDDRKHAEAAVALRNALAKQHLATMLEAGKDKRPRVRAGVVVCLSKLENNIEAEQPEALRRQLYQFIPRCIRDKDVGVRRSGVVAASPYCRRSPEILAAVIKALDDPSKQDPQHTVTVSVTAARVLGRVGLGAAGRPAHKALFRVAQKGPEETRRFALHALGRLAADDKEKRLELHAFLLRQLREATPPRLRIDAACGLCFSGAEAKAAVPALRELFQLKDVKDKKVGAFIRLNVLHHLAQIGPPAKVAVPDFLPILQDSSADYGIRDQIVRLVVSLGKDGVGILPLLEQIAGDDRETAVMRYRARWGAEKLKKLK